MWAVAQHAAVGLLEVSWLKAPLWAAVQRPGELQAVCRLCFGSCCADVRLMAGLHLQSVHPMFHVEQLDLWPELLV